MAQIGVCPEVSAYRDLMRGYSVPHSGALLAHLNACSRCQQVVKMLDDVFSRSLAPDSESRRLARQVATGASRAGAATGMGSSDAGGDSLVVLPSNFLSPPQAPGEVGRLGGYRVLGVLGKGGMGIVFKAEDAQLGRRVALKVMRPEIAAYPSHRDRFLHEARAVASVESDFVCPIHQVGEANGVPFIAMPLLKGEPLDARMHREKTLPINEAVRIAREIAQGLTAAHEKGLIHRDVKPANVWLETTITGPARARLLDFGLARGGGDGRLTRTGEVMGTPAYLSPEQGRGQRVDARTDLFSLGIILYEMLTGQRPFGGTNAVSMLTSLAMDTPEPPTSLRPEISEALSDLVMELLEKAANQRPGSAAEVAARLAVLEKTGTWSNDVLRMKTQIRPVAAARRRWAGLSWAAALGLVLCLGGGLVAYVLASGEKPEAQAGSDDRSGDDKDAQANRQLENEQARKAEEEAAKKAEQEKKRKDEAEASYRAAMKKATQALEAKQYAEARAQYAEALKHRPNDPAATEGDADAATRLVKQTEAKKKDAAYQQAMQKADSALKLKKYADARQAYREALGHKPQDEEALEGEQRAATLLTQQELAMKKAAEAEKFYLAAVDACLGLTGNVDEAQALKLFGRAAEKEHVVAGGWIGRLTYLGRGTKKDETEGVKLVKEVLPAVRDQADEGKPDAQALLGALLAEGIGVRKDETKAVEWLEMAQSKGHVDATYHLARAYEQGRGVTRNHARAFELYQKAADKGHAAAAFALAAAYELGRGVARDEKKAVEWHKKAANKGYARAAYPMGERYFFGLGVDRDEKLAVEWYKKAADRGESDAMNALGWVYTSGRGVDTDYKQAVKWFLAAAEAGNAQAAANLGVMYEYGRGVSRDQKKAAEWYRKSADRGNAAAMNDLGAMYADGLGVEKDEDEAVKWFRKAAAAGNARGMSNLGWAYANGHGVNKDEKKAAEWYRKSAEAGNPLAMAHLGWVYANGRGFDRDYKKAAEWYGKAADKGNAAAMNNLGALYVHGRGVDQDDKLAVKWFEKAADNGSVTAMNWLGWVYANGRGVSRDVAKSQEWYRKANGGLLGSKGTDVETVDVPAASIQRAAEAAPERASPNLFGD